MICSKGYYYISIKLSAKTIGGYFYMVRIAENRFGKLGVPVECLNLRVRVKSVKKYVRKWSMAG
jgi:hypothetical protein